MRRGLVLAALAAGLALAAGCGKKGPPRPPVREPPVQAAPASSPSPAEAPATVPSP